MNKAISTHTLFLVGTMALFLIFTVTALWIFLGQIEMNATQTTCAEKYLNYCMRWKLNGDDPDDWEDINPQGCDQFDIYKPSSIDDCKNIT